MSDVSPRSVNGAALSGEAADPVFVLCMGRSGSTLLRFLLDAHPDLACPPETSLPALCAQLAVVWSLIEGAPLSQNRGDAPPQVPDPAIAGIRHMVDMMTESYLARRAKKRFCDKSLGSAAYADLLLRVYPEARFICLYRHPMDMIRSGMDACPWGLTGYGFDQYIGSSPGNAVMALARYWLDNATAIAAVEEQHPDRCHRVRYEDLVSDPEKTAQGIYAFLGVTPAPGITRTCFSRQRERFGPGDHKIWATSGITTDSVGTGESVPASLIPPPVVTGINELAGKLGYRPVDEDWGTPGRPADPRLPSTISPADQASPAGQPAAEDDSEPPAETSIIDARLRAGLTRAGHLSANRQHPATAEKFLVVSRTPAAGGTETWWLVDPAAGAVTRDDENAGDADWKVVGAPGAWHAVLSGRTNLHVALRRCDLRYCAPDEEGPLAVDRRIAMLADFLGLGSWLLDDTGGREDGVRPPVPAAVPS
jgi:hypothetical protein